MLRSIIGSSLKFQFVVLAIAAILLVVGVLQLRQMPVDVLPEFSPPYVEIQTEALGLSAPEVEQLVTLGLEQDLLNGVPWLDSIRSESLPGLSSILLIFEPGTDILRARQLVSERLAQAFALPHVSKPPNMIQPLSSSSRFMIVGLSSKNLSLIQMSVLARWTIGPRLMGVPGVANVAIWGQRDRQLQVQVDPKRLQENKVSMLQVLETTGNALWVSSLSFIEASTPGTGGFIDTTNQRLGIRHLLPIVSSEGLAQVPIEGTSRLRLSDVANVVEDHQPLIGDALTNDNSSLLLVIEKFPGSNTLKVTRGVEDALTELSPGLSGLEMDPSIYRPADFIEMAMNNLALAGLIGLIFIVLLLAAFFFEWQTTLISLVTIPVSFVTAGLVLYWTGATLNMIVLTGFLIAIGVVVEDAIIDVENIMRRLRQAREQGSVRSTMSIILEASFEMRNPIIYATLILLLVISPIFFIGGSAGTFIQPLAISYGLAVLASMLVALTVTPALCLILLANAPVERRTAPLAVRLQQAYETRLAGIIHRGRLAFMITGGLTLIALVILPFLNLSLLPAFKERNLQIQLNAVPGTSQPEMSRITGRISEELRSIPEVSNVAAHIGRAVLGDLPVNVNSAELWVSIDPAADYDQTTAAIKKVVNGYPGLHHNVQTYLNQVSSQMALEPSDSLVVRVYGDTDKALSSAAEDVKKSVEGINGITSANVKLPVKQPIMEVEVNLAAAQKYGLKPGDVRRAAAIMFSGLQVGSLFEEQKVFDVVVWSIPETRQSLNSIRDLMIDTPGGGQVRLGDVAEVRIVSTPSIIHHEAVHRYIDVVANIKGRSLGAVAGDINNRLKQMHFPLEYHAEVLGGDADQQSGLTRLLVFAAAAILGIFLLLQASFRSWRLAAVAVFTLPMALAGSVVAAFLTGGVISLGSLAGFLTVLGVAIRNSIVTTNHFNHLERYEGQTFGPELVLRGARERLTPILMTALATALALLPVLLLGNIAGLEIVRPMAVIVVGGLITSTLLDLFVLPTLYLLYGANRERDIELLPTTVADFPAAAADD